MHHPVLHLLNGVALAEGTERPGDDPAVQTDSKPEEDMFCGTIAKKPSKTLREKNKKR